MANVDDLVKKSYGQLGSVFSDVDGAITPPTGKVFIAVTFLEDTTFDGTGGLVADTNYRSCEYIGTNAAAHDASTATVTSGTGGEQVDGSNTFPQGLTIFGRWTEIDIGASGSLIAYIGD